MCVLAAEVVDAGLDTKGVVADIEIVVLDEGVLRRVDVDSCEYIISHNFM